MALAWVRRDGVLPPEAVARLEAAAPFERGFPAGFIAACEAGSYAFGEAAVVR